MVTSPKSDPRVIREKLLLLGELLYLLTFSKVHERFSVRQIAQLILPRINRNEFRVYRTKRGPVGFVTWAYLTDEASVVFAAGKPLNAEQFSGGKNLWVLDFIAPFGHAPKIVEDLRDNVFQAETRLRAVRRDEQGAVLRVIELRRSSKGISPT